MNIEIKNSVVVIAPTKVDLQQLHDELHPRARAVSINLLGDTFSRDGVSSLFERLNEELGVDGLVLTISPAPQIQEHTPASSPPSEDRRSSTIHGLGGGTGAAQSQPPVLPEDD